MWPWYRRLEPRSTDCTALRRCFQHSMLCRFEDVVLLFPSVFSFSPRSFPSWRCFRRKVGSHDCPHRFSMEMILEQCTGSRLLRHSVLFSSLLSRGHLIDTSKPLKQPISLLTSITASSPFFHLVPDPLQYLSHSRHGFAANSPANLPEARGADPVLPCRRLASQPL